LRKWLEGEMLEKKVVERKEPQGRGEGGE